MDTSLPFLTQWGPWSACRPLRPASRDTPSTLPPLRRRESRPGGPCRCRSSLARARTKFRAARYTMEADEALRYAVRKLDERRQLQQRVISAIGVEQVLRRMVANSAISVPKLCAGLPSSSSCEAALRSVAAERFEERRGEKKPLRFSRGNSMTLLRALPSSHIRNPFSVVSLRSCSASRARTSGCTGSCGN